jgi:hypothetical protein
VRSYNTLCEGKILKLNGLIFVANYYYDKSFLNGYGKGKVPKYIMAGLYQAETSIVP